MMFVDDVHWSCTIILLSHLVLTQATDMLSNNATMNITTNGNLTIVATTVKNRIDQGKEIIHDAFAKMDRGTLIRGVIVLAGITCLVLMYIGIKTLLLRKKRRPKKYTLINDPTSMQEPLFGPNDDEEEEIEDDTLFVRK